MALDFEKPLEEIENRISELKKLNEKADVSFDTEISALERKLRSTSKRVYSKLSPWETVQIARHAERPLLRDYIAGLCTEFLELHGDRCFGDDQGIIGGFATLRQHRVMVIGHQKGRSVEEKIAANFGMASPDGYRKAMRLMHLAAKYRLPIVSFIDTPGAYPGLEAEARGQAEAIARNLTEMSLLPVPVIVVVTGEGGSGGAIGIGVGNVVLMLSNAVYSVISPEGSDALQRGLLRHFTRRLRLDPVARRQQGPRGRGRAQDYGRLAGRAGHCGRDYPRAGGRRPPQSECRHRIHRRYNRQASAPPQEDVGQAPDRSSLR